MPGIKACGVYGSTAAGTHDEYSDIDVEIDVSGMDNALFAKKLPGVLSQKYHVIFADYASSLAPQNYVVTVALTEKNPFMTVDFSCVATPHCGTLSKTGIAELNHPYTHTLKLFCANLKRFIRGENCREDIEKMYGTIGRPKGYMSEGERLSCVYEWLRARGDKRYKGYVNAFEAFF